MLFVNVVNLAGFGQMYACPILAQNLKTVHSRIADTRIRVRGCSDSGRNVRPPIFRIVCNNRKDA